MQVGYIKVVFYNQSRRLWLRCLTTANLYLFAMVIHVHDSALAEEYAVDFFRSQISFKALKLWPRYGDFSIFQNGGRRHLGFVKF